MLIKIHNRDVILISIQLKKILDEKGIEIKMSSSQVNLIVS